MREPPVDTAPAAEWKSYYARQSWRFKHYLARFQRYVEAHGVPCQDCGGMGGETNVVIPETGQGPWETCGWCEGTGKTTKHLRGLWMRIKKQEKRERLARIKAA